MKIRIRPVGFIFGVVLAGLVFAATELFGLGIWEAVSLVGVSYLIGGLIGFGTANYD